jgi:ATP-dependent DNA helicase DinG
MGEGRVICLMYPLPSISRFASECGIIAPRDAPRKNTLLNRIYVALDLETTGLDAQRDSILEIGAVKFRGDEILDTFTSLVNPGRPVPLKITELTGIEDAMVQNAPSLWSVLPRLSAFVRDLPVIGHNVAFDLGFLRRHQVLLSNESLDTFELAGILVPHEERYSLGKLTQALGVQEPQDHRALGDAQLAYQLFVKLFDRACQIPTRTLEEIVKLSQPVGWTPGQFFEDALKAAARGAFEAGSIGAQIAAKQAAQKRRTKKASASSTPLFLPALDAKPLQPAGDASRVPLDIDALAALLEPGGPLSQQFPGYEFRPQQVQMLRAVSQSLNEGSHALVEAGTGTGKSLAYLLPAVHWAYTNGQRVVVSTNTINLQEQLYHKDLPDLARLLPFEFHAAVLKGRSHYLCASRLKALRHAGPASPEEMRVLCKVLLWLPGTVTGDGDELFLPNPVERAVWSRLSADNEACTPERCMAAQRGECFFYRARKAAESAHVIIVNHALLLADIAVDNRALPEYDYLIVDEAHHLEDATTQQLSFSVDRNGMQRLLADIGKAGEGRRVPGLLADLIGRVRHAVPDELAHPVESFVDQTAKAVDGLMRQSDDLFDQVAQFVQGAREDNGGEYSFKLRLVPAVRAQPAWSSIEVACDNLGKGLFAVADSLARLGQALNDLDEYDIPDAEDLQARVLGLRREVAEVRQQLVAILCEPESSGIYWAELASDQNGGWRGGNRLLSLHSAPLHIGPLVEKYLFKSKKSVVMTSATLRTGGTFDFIKERLHAWDADELSVGSPFDFKRSTLLYLVADVPEPGAQGYQRALEQGLISLCRAMGGRTLVLFTSYSQLRATNKALAPALVKDDITVYEQSDGSSRRQLLENFKNAERGVLLGTRSFWEGVDVPGEALSCLAIVRLPFAVPTDPVFAARSETFDQAFTEYSVPDAILRFRQGFGRLIRTATDRGVVVVFDRRLLTKTYGQTFLKSLPECTVRRGTLSELAGAVAEWVKR